MPERVSPVKLYLTANLTATRMDSSGPGRPFVEVGRVRGLDDRRMTGSNPKGSIGGLPGPVSLAQCPVFSVVFRLVPVVPPN